MLERLFGQQLGALTQECIQVVSRDIVSQFVSYTLYMVDARSELTMLGPPSLQLSFLKRGTLPKGFHWLLITEPCDRVSSKI